MSISKLNNLIDNAIKERRYLEAFLMKSLYIESIITVLATAIRFHDKGYNGNTLSVSIEVENNLETKKFFKESMGSRLSENIALLGKANFFMGKKDADYLHTWKDKYRDNIFHNMAHPMLADELLRHAEEGVEFTKKFTNQEWFKKMEESFIESEKQFNLKS